MPHPNVSVVITNDNRLQSLRASIASVRSRSGFAATEIVVVDRGSSDGSLEFLADADVTVIEYPGCTLAEAMNAALKKIPEGDLVYLGQDTIPQSDGWLAAFVKYRQEHGEDHHKLAVIGGRLITASGSEACAGRSLISGLGDASEQVLRSNRKAGASLSTDTVEVDAAAHGFAYYTREAIDRVAPFQECYGQGSAHEDDFCLTARCHGLRVVTLPQVLAVRHRAVVLKSTQLPFDDPMQMGYRSARAHSELTTLSHDVWQERWGFNPSHPDLALIRKRYAGTQLLWGLGDNMRFWPSSEWPTTDLVIATKDNQLALRETLESLAQTHYPQLQIHVVDQHSSDGTAAMLREMATSYPFPLKVTHLPVDLGKTAAQSLVISECDADLVVQMSDSLSVAENWLEGLVTTLRDRPFAAAVAPMLIAPNGWVLFGPRIRMHPAISRGHWTADDQRYRARVTDLDSRCVLYRRDALKGAGSFDSSFSSGSLDASDRHIAMQAAGFELIADGNVEVQVHDRETDESAEELRASAVANGYKLINKWGTSIWETLETAIDESAEGRTLAGTIASKLGAALPDVVEPSFDIACQERQQELAMLISSEVQHRSYHDDVLATGKQFLSSGDAERARSVFLSLVDIAPYCTDALFWAGECCARLADHEQASALAQRAVELGGVIDRDLEELRGQFPPQTCTDTASRAHANQLHVLLLNLSPHGPNDGTELVATTATILRQSDIAVDIARFGSEALDQYDLVHAFHSDDPLSMHTALAHIRAKHPDLPIIVSPQYQPHREQNWIENSIPYLFASASSEEQLLEWLVSMADEMLTVNGSNERELEDEGFDGFERVQHNALDLSDGVMVYSSCEAEHLREQFGLGVRVSECAAIPPAALRSPVGEDAFVQRYGLRDFVLFPGPISAVKNQLLGLYALAKSDLPCVVVGNFTDLHYERLCRQHARKGTIFLPELSPPLFASAMAAARVVGLPSWFDVNPSLALAAQVQDCSCVVSEGGASEQILGELASTCDPADLLSVHGAFEQAWQNHGDSDYEREQWRHRNDSLIMRKQAAAELLHIYRSAIEQREGALMSTTTRTDPSA